jgi:hypothetical protein
MLIVVFTQFATLNLWNPTHISGWASLLIVALLLGMVHGITPDEHTWPITFSYAIGSYSTRRGLRAGVTFSLAFTLQRAIASELAYLGLSHLYTFDWLNNIIYIIVGILMAAAGVMIVQRNSIVHFDLPFLKVHHPSKKSPTESWLHDPKPWMPAVHGFVAGWGFGAFAIIIYTVLAPATGSAIWGWVPGAVFGFGTMIMQAIAGAVFGYIAARRGLGQDAIRRVALKTAGATLTWGGLAFVIAGIFGQLFPNLANANLNTGVHVHNLDQIGLAFILVIVCVVGVGATTLVRSTRTELHKLKVN